MIKLKSLISKRFFYKLEESLKTAEVVLGVVHKDGEIMAIPGNNDMARHPETHDFRTGNKFRYVPEIQYLSFWEYPTDEEREIVGKFLEQHGLEIKYVNVYTARE